MKNISIFDILKISTSLITHYPTHLLKNSLWNTLGYSYLILASLVSLPFLVHGLSTSSYGMYLVVSSAVAVSSSLDLGVPTSLVKHLASSKSARDRVLTVRTGLVVILPLVVALGLLGYLFSLLSGLLPDLTHILAPSLYLIVVTHLVSYFASVPQGLGDFSIANTRAYIVGTGNTLLAAAVALASGSLVAVLWVQVASGIFCLLLLLIYCVSKYGLRALLPFYSKERLTPFLKFGLRVFVANLAPQIEANLARIFSATTLTPAMLSALGIAQSLVQKGTGLFNQFTTALLPTASALASHKKISNLKKIVKLTTLGFFVSTLLALGTIYLYGSTLLNLWLENATLAESVYPLLLLYLGSSTILSLTPSPATALTASGHPGLPARTAWTHLGIELLLLTVLLPRYGVVGAPLASLLALIVPTALLWWYYKTRIV